MSDPLKYVLLLRDGLEAMLQDCGADPDKAHIVSMVVQKTSSGQAIHVSNLSVVDASAQPSSHDLMKVWERVIEYRDKHEITCAESIYQMDGPVVDASDLAADLVGIIGFGRHDEDTDEYIGGTETREFDE